jgi:hypothetical protein
MFLSDHVFSVDIIYFGEEGECGTEKNEGRYVQETDAW